MNIERLAENVNKLGYPKTVTDKGWLYGVWYCGTSFQKSIYYGQYPATFVKRILAMFPGAAILHLCCGRCKIEGAVNVDFHDLPEVDVIADVEALPENLKQGQFDVVLIDPPYSDQDADRYKVPRLINSRKTMLQAREALSENGYLLWLDEKYPVYRRKEWQLVGLISIVTGFERRVRVLSVFKKRLNAVLNVQVSDTTDGE